jgi:hypothetical protein
MFWKGVLLFSLAATACAFGPAASAVALRPGKATDSSVCDLGPNTSQLLGSQVLVPAVANPKDKLAVYVRLAGLFVTERCMNGQVLILHGNSDVDTDRPALEEVANSSCRVADIKLSEGQASDGPYTYGTFEFRCSITKLDEFKAKLKSAESQDPLEALKGRLAAAARSGRPASESKKSSPEKDCRKVTLGTLIQGGDCK